MARRQFLLRIDPELLKELEKWAADDLRSINSQIEWLLREAVRKRRRGRSGRDQASRASGDDPEDDDAPGSRLETKIRDRAARLEP